MALVTRALTGSVILPDGTPVSSGQVKFFPVGQLPADMDALLVRSGITLSIVDGEISGNIVAPCNYRILVYSGTSRVVSFRGGITETDPHDPLTLQQIYAANVDADDVVIIQGPQGDQGLPGNGVHWFYLPFTPVRTAERTFTLADTENAGKYDLMCQRGTVFKWLDGTDYKMACVHSAVYADDVVTFTLMGDTISEGVDMTTMQYFIEKAKTITFTVAGNLPSNATEVAGYFPVPYQIKLLGADAFLGGTYSATNTYYVEVDAMVKITISHNASNFSSLGTSPSEPSVANIDQKLTLCTGPVSYNTYDLRVHVHFVPAYIYLLE